MRTWWRAATRQISLLQVSRAPASHQARNGGQPLGGCCRCMSDTQWSRRQVEGMHRRQERRALSSGQEKYGRATPFKLADIGEGITEVEVLRWFVDKGEHVKQFQTLLEVQSDKATVDISSRFEGTIRELCYTPGDIATVGEPLCYIETEGDASAAAEERSEALLEAGKDEGAGSMAKPLAAPPVRKYAKDNEIDLARVRGSGIDGRILKEDVMQYMRDSGLATEAGDTSETPPGVYLKSFTQREQQRPGEKVEPIRGLQRAMVKTMTAALSVPHLNLADEINMDELVRVKRSVAPWALQRHDLKVTYLPFLVKATSVTLSSFPILNARVDDKCENIIYQESHNISVAMDTPHGLVVPNLKSVQQLSVMDIAFELGRLSEEAKSGRFREEDLAGGTFALSNVGSIGGTYTSPVLMVPQVAIGAIGRIQKVPRFDENGTVSVRSIAHITWAADHRIIDGATIANFSNAWKNHVENPAKMLLELR